MRSSGLRATLAIIAGTLVAATPALFAGQTAPGATQAGGRQGGPPPPQPGGFQRLNPLPFPDAPQVVDSSGLQLRVVPVVKGLATPWSLAFLPNGDMLVTEKGGALRIVRGGTLDPTPIPGTPQVVTQQQGGLLEVTLHPQFAKNQFVYLTYSKATDNGATTALARGRFDGKALVEVKDLLVTANTNTGGVHFGSRLAFGRDGFLYMSAGERNDRDRAQRLDNHGGKILRLNDDGTAAAGNPFAGKDGAKPEIFSYGHRNVQGLAVHPETGAVWATEHGPQGGDELNLVQAGKNYGWPVITYGREYSGEIISAQPARDGMEQPFTFWSPSPALSGMVFYTGDKFPWKGQLILGALAGMGIYRVGMNEKGLLGRESMLTTLRQRIRDVRQGPDGFLYLVVDANPGGILRLEPAAAATGSK